LSHLKHPRELSPIGNICLLKEGSRLICRFLGILVGYSFGLRTQSKVSEDDIAASR
jgi:hypothetical protein